MRVNEQPLGHTVIVAAEAARGVTPTSDTNTMSSTETGRVRRYGVIEFSSLVCTVLSEAVSIFTLSVFALLMLLLHLRVLMRQGALIFLWERAGAAHHVRRFKINRTADTTGMRIWIHAFLPTEA